MDILFLVFGLLIALGLVLLFFQYRRLSNYKKKVEEAWNRIGLQLERRYKVLPALMDLVQAHAENKTLIFEKIVTFQRQAASAANILDQASAENDLSKSIKTLFALSEDHPALKRQKAFRDLQQILNQIEDDIYLTRQKYNTIVKENNLKVKRFPGNLIAAPLGFGRFDLFEIKI